MGFSLVVVLQQLDISLGKFDLIDGVWMEQFGELQEVQSESPGENHQHSIRLSFCFTIDLLDSIQGLSGKRQWVCTAGLTQQGPWANPGPKLQNKGKKD